MPVLIKLLGLTVAKKADLRSTVKTAATLDAILHDLSSEGYIDIKETFLGRRTYTISLTQSALSGLFSP